MTTDIDWQREARRILKTELVAEEVSFKELARALKQFGIDEEPKVLSNKVNRGTFSFIFFLQCMRAIGTKTIKLPD
jgi:signal recognition particle subunit SEC65